jgi:GxxExxY protein
MVEGRSANANAGEDTWTQMNADERREELDKLTEAIVGCAFKVSNALGVGFLEKVYENALAVELRRAGLKVQQQYPMKVTYEGTVVGDFAADLLIEESVVVELKALSGIEAVHRAQCLNYLRAAGLRVGLVINFGRPKLEVKRVVNGF